MSFTEKEIEAAARALLRLTIGEDGDFWDDDEKRHWCDKSRAALAAVETLRTVTDAARLDALAEVAAERVRQNEKWGEQNHADGTGRHSTPVAEIVRGRGHAVVNLHYAFGLASNAKEATDRHAAEGRVTWADILLEEVFEVLAEDDPAKVRTELVQVAAVAVQWVEAIDRRGEGAGK